MSAFGSVISLTKRSTEKPRRDFQPLRGVPSCSLFMRDARCSDRKKNFAYSRAARSGGSTLSIKRVRAACLRRKRASLGEYTMNGGNDERQPVKRSSSTCVRVARSRT